MRASAQARTLAAITCIATLGCDAGEPAPPAGPGEVVARLVSPNGAEGAAVVELTGAGIGEVRGAPGTTVFAAASGPATRVVVLRDTPGELAFHVRLAERSAPPAARVIEVADGEDRLRASLAGYRVAF